MCQIYELDFQYHLIFFDVYMRSITYKHVHPYSIYMNTAEFGFTNPITTGLLSGTANANEVDCCVCFCPIGRGENIKCSKWTCPAQLCVDCLQLLIQYSHDADIIPACPNNECKSTLLYADIEGFIDSEHKQLYHRTIAKFLIKNKGQDAEKSIAHKQMIKKLRDGRRIFIEKNFPPAILTVALIAFPGKLKQVEKSAKTRIDSQLAGKKPCFNLSCCGSLILETNVSPSSVNVASVATPTNTLSQYKCCVCDTHFCEACEKPVNARHKCRQEDVDSVKYIQSLVKCPNCLFPIIKSQGCHSMRCSNCGTDFDYETGQVGGHGNSHNMTITVRKQYTLSAEFDKLEPQIFDLLLQFEALKPKICGESFMRTIEEYIAEKTSTTDSKPAKKTVKRVVKRTKTVTATPTATISVDAVDTHGSMIDSVQPDDRIVFRLSKQYNQYIHAKYQMQKYTRLSAVIEDKIRKDNITIQDLKQAIAIMQ